MSQPFGDLFDDGLWIVVLVLPLVNKVEMEGRDEAKRDIRTERDLKYNELQTVLVGIDTSVPASSILIEYFNNDCCCQIVHSWWAHNAKQSQHSSIQSQYGISTQFGIDRTIVARAASSSSSQAV